MHDIQSEIEARRRQIAEINNDVDAWNREVTDGADPSVHAEDLARAAREKAAHEIQIFELEARMRSLEEEQPGDRP